MRVETTFEAAHRRDPAGEETSLHHHDWQVAVRARADELDHIGLVIDFRVLRAVADEAVAELDQRVLEELDGFVDRPPTPAVVAEWLFHRLSELLASGDEPDGDAGRRFWLQAVEVEADPGIRFEYVGDR